MSDEELIEYPPGVYARPADRRGAAVYYRYVGYVRAQPFGFWDYVADRYPDGVVLEGFGGVRNEGPEMYVRELVGRLLGVDEDAPTSPWVLPLYDGDPPTWYRPEFADDGHRPPCELCGEPGGGTWSLRFSSGCAEVCRECWLEDHRGPRPVTRITAAELTTRIAALRTETHAATEPAP